MTTIGLLDTTFSKIDLGAYAMEEFKKHNVEIKRLTVPGIKDLPWGCMKLLQECEGVLATGMVGKAFIDVQCSHEASQGIIAAQIATQKPVLGAMIFENEANNAEELESIAKDRVQKHAENIVIMLTKPGELTARAGKGIRQGKEHEGKLTERKPRVAIVWSFFNQALTSKMKDAAIKYIGEFGGEVAEVKCVRGSWEIPFMVKKILERNDVDAVVTLGCIIKGKTMHDEVIGFSVGNKLLDLSCEYSKPVSLGIIGPGVKMEDAQMRWEGYAYGACEGAVSTVLISRGKKVTFKDKGH